MVYVQIEKFMLYYNYEKSRKGRNRAEKKEKALPIREILLQKKTGGKRNQSPLLTLYKSCYDYIICLFRNRRIFTENKCNRRKIAFTAITAERFLLQPRSGKNKTTACTVRSFLAGVAGFEPTNDGVRVRGLTAWRHPYSIYF